MIGLFGSGIFTTSPGAVLLFNSTGVANYSPGGNLDTQQPIWNLPRPRDRWNSLEGRTCVRTGYWAPAKDIVYVDGAPYINIFAPKKGARERYQKS